MSRALTIRLWVALAALAIGSGALQATNKLALTYTSGTSASISCDTHIVGQATATIRVAAATALTGTNTLAVTVPSSMPGGLVISPSTSQTLTSSTASVPNTSITYTVTTANSCASVANATVNFNFSAGGTADVQATVVTSLITSAALTVGISPSSLVCSLQSGPTPVTLVVKPTATLGSNQTIPVTLGTVPSGLLVTPPSVTTLSSSNQTAGLSYTVSTATGCAGISNGGTPSIPFLANALADASETVPTSVTSSTQLILNPSSITPTCSTATGPTSTPITVTPAIPLTTGQSIAVTFVTPSGGLTVTAPNVTTLTPANPSLTYNVSQAAGCVGVTNGGTPSVQFKAGGTTDAALTTTTTLANSISGLSVSSAVVVLNCVLTGSSTYTPGVAQTVAVTSTASAGTPFSFPATGNGLPTGVTVSPTSYTGSAGSTAINLSFQAAAGCGGYALNSSTTGTFVLTDAPGPVKNISVTLQVTGPTPLSASPSPASLTYVKGSGTPSTVAIAVSSSASPAPFFTVDTTSLPTWLTVDSISGTAPKTLRFSSTSVCDSLPPGTYSASVRLDVSTAGALTVPISMLITNSAPKLSVTQSPLTTWTMGQSVPTAYITLFSTDSPIPYSLTGSGLLQPAFGTGMASGLAYSFGTEIPITFSNTAFAAAQPASVLTGTVTITWGSPASTTVVTFSITVLSAQATISSISPASVPTTSTTGQQFIVDLSGTGFVQSSDLTQKTKVGVVSNGTLVQDTNIASSITNASNMVLTITATSNDTYLNFASSGTVVIGVCNPQGSTCSVPSSTVTLTISAGPVIQEVTSASSFQQVNAGTNPNVSPYDMLSIFGTNFCAASMPACSSTQIIPGVLNAATLVYQTWLATDAAGPTQRQLTVEFCPTGTTTSCVNAPLLFATNSQINLLVPSTLTPSSQYDIIVSYGYGTSTNMFSSSPLTVNVVATDPGIFAVGADGQGSGAILNTSWALVNSANPAGMRSTATDSDTVQIYMTGLGVPTASTGCMTPAAYATALSTASNVTVPTADGAIIQNALLPTSTFPPCLTTMPTVKVGGVTTATPLYAGWVDGSVAGLYQVNVTLPGSGAGPFTDVNGTSHATITAPVQLPISITANSVTSQTGVSIWVAPRLLVAAPSTVIGVVGQTWGPTNTSVVATEGTSPYHFAVSSGVLPTGLTLNATTGAITGIPVAGVAGTYNLTVTATDSAYYPVTGSVSFTLTVSGGLTLTSSVPSYTHNVVAASTNIATVTAAGGVNPYAYSFDSAFTPVPTGMTVNSSTGVVSITQNTPGGSYTVIVDATDANGWTGKISIPVTLNLLVTATSGSVGLTGTSPTFTGSSTGTPYTVNFAATGGAAYTFAMPAQSGFSLNSSTGVLTVTAPYQSGAYSVDVTATENTSGATGTLTVSITMSPVTLSIVATAGTNLSGSGTSFSGTDGGGPYTITLATTGGPSPTYSITSQSGGGSITLSTNTLTLGTSARGTYTVTVHSTDAGNSASTTLTIDLVDAVTVSAAIDASDTTTAGSGTSFSDSATNSPFVLDISATGGTGSGWVYNLTAHSGPFSLSGGTLTLTTTTAGTYTATVSATDGNGNSGSISISIVLD